MAGVSATTEIECATAKVFECVSDPTSQAKWMPSIEKVEHTEGPRGQVGGKYRQTVTMMGQTQEGALEIVECQSPTRFRTRVKGGPATIDSLFELSEQSGATRVKMTVEAGPMLAIIAPMIRKQLEQGLARLKELLES